MASTEDQITLISVPALDRPVCEHPMLESAAVDVCARYQRRSSREPGVWSRTNIAKVLKHRGGERFVSL